MEKHAAAKVKPMLPVQPSSEYFNQEIQDLQNHIHNFDNLIEEIEHKLQRRSEESLKDEASMYKENISDLESGLDIWNEKCHQAETYLKECLVARNDITKNFEKTLDEIGKIKEPQQDVKYVNISTQKVVEKTVKQMQVLEPTLNQMNSNETDSKTPLTEQFNIDKDAPIVNTSQELTESVPVSPDRRTIILAVQNNQNQEVEEQGLNSPLSCNTNATDGMTKEQPIQINLLTYRIQNAENSEMQNSCSLKESTTYKSRSSVIPKTVVCVESCVTDLNNERRSMSMREADVNTDKNKLTCTHLSNCCDASTQTEKCLFRDNQGHMGKSNNKTMLPASGMEQNMIIPTPNYERQYSSLLGNIYQTVASNEMMKSNKQGRNRNRRLMNLMNKWNYDCTNPEEYFDIGRLQIRQPKQNYGMQSEKPIIESLPDSDHNSYSTIHSNVLKAHSKELSKQSCISTYEDHTSQTKKQDKLPYSFYDNKGWYKRREETEKEQLQTGSKRDESFDKDSPRIHSNIMVSKKSKGEETSNVQLGKIKGSSEFHRSCTTPITVRIIKRIESQKQKRLSPIRHKSVPVKRYPISPKYRQPRSYVSAFRRKMTAMQYNI